MFNTLLLLGFKYGRGHENQCSRNVVREYFCVNIEIYFNSKNDIKPMVEI